MGMPRHTKSGVRHRPAFAMFAVTGLTVATLTFSGLAFAAGNLSLDGWTTGSSGRRFAAATTGAPHPAQPEPTSTPTPSPSTPPPPAVFTILAAGDVLTHTPVNQSARTGGDYDFSPLLAGIDAYVQGADLAICHLEVPIVPPGTQPSGYPNFAAPAHLATDLKEQGWDGCSTASNHSVDRGTSGVKSTIDDLDTAGLGRAGTGTDRQDAIEPQLYTLQRAGQTITVAHLSAAYGLNGHPTPAPDTYTVQTIDTATIIGQAKAARSAGADLVVVSVHAGTEYVTAPNPEQLAVNNTLAASGEIDLVIGHHAHVPQPMTHLPGGPGGTGMWVTYGLGNMISNQDGACCNVKTDSGLLATATVTKPADGPARVTGLTWTAITVDRKAGHRLRVLTDAMANPAGGTLSAADLQARYARVRSAVGDAAPEATAPATPTGEPPQAVPHVPDAAGTVGGAVSPSGTP